MDVEYKYVIVDAMAQCGTEPPYNLLNVPVRMHDEIPQIKINGAWVYFPKEGPRPQIDKYAGLPCVGISASWALKRD